MDSLHDLPHPQVHYSSTLGVSYRGLQRSTITFSRSLGLWQIRDMSDPSVLAVSEAPFRSLALGSRSWRVTNDSRCFTEPLQTRLALTSCSQEQFTCSDGLCLQLGQRCDGQPQCRDSSDELACSVLEQDPSYNKFLSPPPGRRLH